MSDLGFMTRVTACHAGSNGELVIFEANPAMNVIEKRRMEDFSYFKNYWKQNLVAFEDMIAKKAGKR